MTPEPMTDQPNDRWADLRWRLENAVDLPFIANASTVADLLAERDELAADVERLRETVRYDHRPREAFTSGRPICANCGVHYPCPTAAALSPEDTGEGEDA